MMNFQSLAIVVAVGVSLAGCAVGPDFQHPRPTDAMDYRPPSATMQLAPVFGTGDEAQHIVRGAEISSRWWEAFQSPPLNALVERALKANPNLDAARAALRVAQENAAAQRGVFWPQIGAAVTTTRQKLADIQSSALNSNASLYSLHTAQLSIGYMPDIFGGNRRQVEAMEAQMEFQRFEFEAARLTIASNVVLAAIQEAALHGQIDATEKIVAFDAELLALTRRQRALGAVPELTVLSQAALLAQAQATLPPLRKQFLQNRDLLVALAGDLPNHVPEEPFEFAALQLPHELPLSLPSRLVEQRPDVLAAEAQAHSASALVGVAFADMLPQFNLSADFGSVAAHMGDLFKAGAGFWTMAGSVAQPIFQGGALSHRKAAAEAGYEQAMAQYRATLIAAMQNVADTLHALEQDAETERKALVAEQAIARSLDISYRQVELGDISHLALLNAEQAYLQAQIGLVQSRANRYADTVALFQALGGGWWTELAS